MYKSLIIAFFVCCISGCDFLSSDQPYSSIKSIRSFSEFNFDTIRDPGSLVLFDVDETLIQPTDTYLIHEHTPEGVSFRQKLKEDNPDYKDWDEVAGIMLTKTERPLIEPSVLRAINSVKRRGVKVFAITNMNTGPFPLVKKMESWRYAQLKGVGFEGSEPEQLFPINGFKKNPVFYRGIIATDTEDKGKVLEVVLDKFGMSPPEIIMFDDTLEYLESVAKVCRDRNIPFEGYHYKGAKFKPWNEKLVRFQAETLLHKKIWVSDHLAKMRLSLK